MSIYWSDDGYDWREEDGDAYMADRFRDPGGRSALHPGERRYPCPTCGEEDSLTARDVAAHYQCDVCADREEGVGP